MNDERRKMNRVLLDCALSSTLPHRRLCRKCVHASTGSPRMDHDALQINCFAVLPELVEGRAASYDTVSPGKRWGGLRSLNSKGFTLIEIIAIMIIVGILAAFLMPRIDFTLSTSASVDGAAYMVASDIRYTQEFAMANQVSKSIVFTSGSTSYTFSPTSTLDPSGKLPAGVTMNTTQTITFNSLGEPTTGGGTSVTVTGGGQTKTISVVSYTGKVNIS